MFEPPVANRFESDEVTERLESAKAEMFFPNIQPPKDIEDIINNMTRQGNIRAMGPQEVTEYAVVLSSYSLYLSIQENRYTSFINWCESNIKYIVGREINNIDISLRGYFPTMDAWIRSNNPTAMELDNRKCTAQVKLDSIKFIAQRIQFLTDTLKNLSFQKNRKLVDV